MPLNLPIQWRGGGFFFNCYVMLKGFQVLINIQACNYFAKEQKKKEKNTHTHFLFSAEMTLIQ